MAGKPLRPVLDVLGEWLRWCGEGNLGFNEDTRAVHFDYGNGHAPDEGAPPTFPLHIWQGMLFYRRALSVEEWEERRSRLKAVSAESRQPPAGHVSLSDIPPSARFVGVGHAKCVGPQEAHDGHTDLPQSPCPPADWIRVELPITDDYSKRADGEVTWYGDLTVTSYANDKWGYPSEITSTETPPIRGGEVFGQRINETERFYLPNGAITLTPTIWWITYKLTTVSVSHSPLEARGPG
jgi:hypothetical protein